VPWHSCITGSLRVKQLYLTLSVFNVLLHCCQLLLMVSTPRVLTLLAIFNNLHSKLNFDVPWHSCITGSL
jgi:hypothetical protein